MLDSPVAVGSAWQPVQLLSLLPPFDPTTLILFLATPQHRKLF